MDRRLLTLGVGTLVVNGNPQAFKNAYWEINSIYVYTPTQDLLGKS